MIKHRHMYSLKHDNEMYIALRLPYRLNDGEILLSASVKKIRPMLISTHAIQSTIVNFLSMFYTATTVIALYSCNYLSITYCRPPTKKLNHDQQNKKVVI